MQDTTVTAAITFALSNFTLTFLVVGLVFAVVNLAVRPKPHAGATIVNVFFRWYLFWPVGVAYLYNFVMHVFYGDVAARFIGWAESPFQAEVGFASLGFAAVALMAAFGSAGLRVGAVVGPSLFTLGAAAGHVYQMVTAGNFAPGNAGVIFWTDIIIPAIGFLLLWFQHREARAAAMASR